MADAHQAETALVDAGLRLAATRPWADIRMTDIAAEANMSLADVAGIIGGKADILRLYGRQLDAKMLRSLDDEPVTGTAHDRVFDIIMRRLELMDGDKAAVRFIAKAPVSSAAGFMTLAGSLLQSQDWILSAAGIEDNGMRGALKTSGLAWVYVKTLRTWAEDDDPGLSRTMAQLDRSLRDGADWINRLETPATLATALASLARGFMKARKGPAPGAASGSTPPSPPQADPNSPTSNPDAT